MDTFLYSLSHTRLAAAGDARQNFDPTSANELGSIHNVTSDSTSTEKEDRTSVETEASGDDGACNGSTNGKASSSGGSSGYEASLATLRDARNSDESSGGQCARKPQRSTQPMPARTVDHLASPCAIASGPTRKSSRLRNKQRRARPEPDACLETGLFTLMLRQIPRHYTQLVFLADVSRCGFMELVDFIYIPFDDRKGKNVGYGFIGFTETPHALAFIQKFDGAYMDTEMRNQGKPLRIHPAAVQGYANSVAHFARPALGPRAGPPPAPLFLPRGSWAGLPPEAWETLRALGQPGGARPPWSPQVPTSASRGLPREAVEEHGGHRRPGHPPGPEAPAAAGLEARAPAPAEEQRGAAAAGARLAARVPPPPGLLAAAGRPASGPTSEVPPLPGPGGQLLHTARQGLLGTDRAPGVWCSPPASVPAAAQASGPGFVGVYQQLEEKKQSLLKELAAVHARQHLALASSMQGLARSPLMLSTISCSSQRGLELQCEPLGVTVGLAQI